MAVGFKEHLKQLGYNPDVPMRAKIDEWFGWYMAENGFYASQETGGDGRTTYKVERLTMKPARMVCQEWASLLMNERTTVSCDDAASNQFLSGDGATDKGYLGTTKLIVVGQRLIERTFAMGTGAWALRVEGLVVNTRGAVVDSPGARIVAQRFDARQIIPLSYDEDTCTECAFLSKVVIAGKALDQLQIHLLIDGRYAIDTVLFDKDGKEVSIPSVAGRFSTASTVPLFALIRPGLENLYWDCSPFGVSVFDDAIGAVKLTDTAIDNTFRDIWLGQKMLFLDERMLTTDKNGKVLVPRAQDQQLFRKAEMDQSSKLIEEYNPDLRVEDNRKALTTAMEVLGLRTGLGDDYFTLDSRTGMITATQVISEQSALFRNLRKHENVLEPAIQTLVRGILTLARTVKGLPIPEDSGEIRVNFDDSIIEDTDAQRKRDLGDVAAGLMRPWEYRVKWYGEEEEMARKMIADVLPPTE